MCCLPSVNRLAVFTLCVSTALMALPALSQATEEVRLLRARMEERNAAIRTAHLDLRFRDFDLDGTKADGRIELYFDGANYLQRLHLGGAVLVEIEKDDVLHRYTIDPDGNAHRLAARRCWCREELNGHSSPPARTDRHSKPPPAPP